MAAWTSRSSTRTQIASVPFDPLTGLKAFVVANALSDIGAPKRDHLAAGAASAQAVGAVPQLRHDHARAQPDPHARRTRSGRLTPVACDFKCGFDRDDPRWQRLDLPDAPVRRRLLRLRAGDQPAAHPPGPERRLRHQRAAAPILAPTFGGGANSLVTEMLGDDAIISSDFGGNPPYEKMKEVARICFKHWLKQTNVLFIIGGKSQQHRHLRDLPRHGRRAARAFQRARADAALRGGRPRRAEPGARHGRAARHAARRWACPTASSASTRDDQRGRQLRPGRSTTG